MTKIMNNSKENELIYLPNGKRVAIDRSVGLVMLAYVISNNDIHILINKRGSKTTEFKNKWNLPSGYINWNESGEEGAIRETFEETGVLIKLEQVTEIEHSTKPSENRQNIIFRYAAQLNEEVLSQKFSIMDNDESTDVMWIKYSELDSVEWAFNQKETIIRMISKIKTDE